MKKLFVLILLAGQTLLAQAQQWHQCLNSYRSVSTHLIDIQYGSVESHDYMMFRNGNHFSKEELNIFYKGKFWKAELEFNDDFYKKKEMSVRLGEDRLCFKRNFNWMLSDKSELSAFYQAACGNAEVITMRENQQDRTPTSEEVLEYKLEKDVKYKLECVAERTQGECSPDNRREAFEKLERWNTDSCESISRLTDVIGMRTEAVQIFNSTAADANTQE